MRAVVSEVTCLLSQSSGLDFTLGGTDHSPHIGEEILRPAQNQSSDSDAPLQEAYWRKAWCVPCETFKDGVLKLVDAGSK